MVARPLALPCRLIAARHQRRPVDKFVNASRTQNGHIRNDTRDVLRRILEGSLRPICRQNCVASDRACTRVTPPNLHGKEGVDGSSPSEGSANRLQIGTFRPGSTCKRSTVYEVWSRLWSPQVQNIPGMEPFLELSRVQSNVGTGPSGSRSASFVGVLGALAGRRAQAVSHPAGTSGHSHAPAQGPRTAASPAADSRCALGGEQARRGLPGIGGAGGSRSGPPREWR